MGKAYSFVAKIVSSQKFFWFILALFTIQDLWVAFSIRYPIVYDEGFHFSVIQIFSHHLSPFITNQPRSYDQFGNLAHTNSVLFHYIMSWPYRLISLFTDNTHAQIVILRILNIIMAASGLWIFAKLFRKININWAYINIGLFSFIMLPLVPMIAATINYDNMLFPLTALYMLVSVRIIKSNKILWYDYANLAIVGCLASLIKFTFLPIFAISFIYLAVLVWKRHGKKFWPRLQFSIKNANQKWLVLAAIGLVVFVGLFSATYIQNIIRYHTPNPSCQQTMSLKRCLSRAIVARDEKARATKNQRPVVGLPEYTQNWFTSMITYSTFSPASVGPKAVFKSPLPIMYNLIFFVALIGVAILLYSWRSISKNASWYFLISMTVALFVSVYIFNVHGYYATHAAFANQPRYLLSMLPVLLVMIAVATGYVLRRRPHIKLVSFIVLLLLFTQGGGIITHIVRSDNDWYWQKPIVINFNQTAKKILQPIVKE